MGTWLARAWLVLALSLVAAGAPAQDSRQAQQRLERIQRELRDVAAERRRIEGERGAASRQLRQVDEQVGQGSRALHDTETALGRDAARLAQLQAQRAQLQAGLAGKREELARLLRAAHAVGTQAPLKAFLAQDQVAQGQRALAYHGYLQRDRARRIETLAAELRQVDALESEITQRRAQLDASRRAQREQLAALEQARRERARVLARLEQQHADRAGRERALGRDARSLQQLLARLRATAAKAAAAKAAAARAAAARKPAATPRAGPGRPAAAPRKAVASAPPLQVGGLGWPVAGALLARYGGTLPDGRSSEGVLIGASAGTTVKAVADGRVVFSDWMNGYGLILIVDHGNGYMSLYAHNDALLRDAGDAVRRGDAVATVGNSGGQGRPGLYFELRRNGQPVDPGTWLRRQ